MSHSIKSRVTALSLATAFASVTAAAVAAPTKLTYPVKSAGAYAGTFYSAGNTGLLSNVTAPSNTISNSYNFINVPGMVTKITVPTGKTALLVSRFAAEAACTGKINYWCSIQILVDGKLAAPTTGKEFSFSTVNAGSPTFFMWQGNSMDRSSEVGSGQHTVVVQEAVNDPSGATNFFIGERSLTVESAIHP